MSNSFKNNSKKTVLLCILDGWGIGDSASKDNAISLADTPNYNQILSDFPHCQLGTSGQDVGLPDGQMGNSEVGHICIGSGRIILQDLPRINDAISDGSLAKNQNLEHLILSCKNSNNVCHLLGLLSDGGVHSHINHIISLAKILAKEGIYVKLHCFLDGRDVAQKSAKIFLQNLLDEIKNFPKIEIATIAGRHYAMDRDQNWDRIEVAYNAIISGNLAKSTSGFINPILAIDNAYKDNITDEFITPIVNKNYQGIQNGDGLLIANFRSDRIRQISSALIDNKFQDFITKKIKFCSAVSMTSYSKTLDCEFLVLFLEIKISNSLGEIISRHNLKQLRVAETEKYAHITFFFSGGQEDKFEGEDRILIKSPDVKTYDLLPEMAAKEVGQKLSEAIKKDQYDFIVVNYANPDMVGHSGVLEASIKACEIIDFQIGMLKDLILSKDGIMIISADHGNIEDMIDEFGNPHTAHTTNLVPFILIGNDVKDIKLKNGRLCDIAPTILSLIKIEKPKEMTGNNLNYQ